MHVRALCQFARTLALFSFFSLRNSLVAATNHSRIRTNIYFQKQLYMFRERRALIELLADMLWTDV